MNPATRLDAAPSPARRIGLRAVAAALVCLLSGCAAQPISNWDQPVVQNPRKNLLAVIDEMDGRRQSITSAVVRMQVGLADSKSGKEYSLNGAYLSDATGRMRLRLQYQSTTVLDMAMDGDRVELWHPRKGKFYRGSRSGLLNGPPNPMALLARVGPVHELLFPRPWAPEAATRRLKMVDGREVVYVQGAPRSGQPLLKRMEIASGVAGAQWMEVFAPQGGMLGKVRYANYQSSEAAQVGDAPVYPRSLLLTSNREQFRLKLDLEDAQFNTTIPPERFRLDTPEDTAVTDLDEALRRGDMPW